MVWKELLRAALMGTDRLALPEAAREALRQMGVAGDLPAHEFVLEGAALLHPLRKAALAPEEFAGEIPAPAPKGEEVEEGAYCSRRSARHLHYILDGTYRPALGEFLRQLAACGLLLPPESLPGLFDRSLQDEALWQQVRPAVGPVGEWLLPQNPRWQALIPSPDPGRWPIAGRDERRRILQSLHRNDPAAARELIREGWPQAHHEEKLDWLAVLAEAPQPADEDLLEVALDDRRKEVRLQVADLLASLPGSALVERLFRHALRYMQLKEDGVIALKPPPELPAELRRDGIRPVTQPPYGGGPRADWLLQMTARIPPSRWNRWLALEPAACLQAFVKTGYDDAFLRALTEATALHFDADWAVALFDYWNRNPDDERWQQPAPRAVLRQLPDELFRELIAGYLEQNSPLVEERSPAGQLLLMGVHPWPDRLALQLIGGFQKWLSNPGPRYEQAWHYKQILKTAAYNIDPRLLDSLKKGWPMTTRIWGLWEKDVEDFLRVLHFRQEMATALTNRKTDEPMNR